MNNRICGIQLNSMSIGALNALFSSAFPSEKDTCGICGPQGGDTLIVSYIRRLGPFFGFKILNFDIFLVFQKNKYFLGYENFVDIVWGHHKIGLYLEVISMHFKVFS